MGRKPKTTLDVPKRRAGDGRPRPHLCVLHGPEGLATHVQPLSPGHHVIGREGDGIVIDDPRASRTHATVHVASRSYKARISDEDSRHGTWVNGERVEEAWLTDGDVFRIGDTLFCIRYVRDGDEEDAAIDAFLGVSPEAKKLRRSIAQVAHHDVTVMILGESGTGKEVVARAIHNLSERPGEFVAVNCAAIPSTLAESQLFGHEAGSFTGASKAHVGLLRAAQSGTLFLDEIGDMPLELQPKLLRALETRTVIPVGSTAPVPYDARIVVATHRKLEDLVEEGDFRGDLYARLAQFELDVPLLADRREDVLPLLYHALDSGARDEPALVDADLAEALLRYPWPYNVRELFAVASELQVRGEDRELLTLDLVAHRLELPERPSSTTSSTSSDGAAEPQKAAPPTREEIEKIVAEHRGNVRAISRATGRSRMQVYRWVEQYGIDLSRYRD